MEIGNDNPLGINDKTGPKGRGTALTVIIAKILEKFLKRRTWRELRHIHARALIDDGSCRNIHHRRGQHFHLVGKASRPVGRQRAK